MEGKNPGRRPAEPARILVEREPGIATLTLNRPRVLNAIDRATLVDLDRAIAQIEADTSVRCVIVTGRGDRAFSTGADVYELARLSPEAAVAQMRYGQAVFRRLSRLPQPVVAAVRGYALGGGFELVQWCDLVVAAEDAVFGHPEITLANVPGWGGSQVLPRLLGRPRAAWVVLSGARWPAGAMMATGLITQLVPADQVLSAARALARDLSERSATALALAKRLVWDAEERPLTEGLRAEADAVGQCCKTEEQRRAVAAFIRRRSSRDRGGQPEWEEPHR